ncbi:pilus assembly protein [Caldimonas sp. KR1-144]|uniref:pilus assembly protein n=1 Tax=Caldimonas sp. KR1-144 TaxID=3400911 RepID=UPI003C0DD9A3
MRTPSCVLGWSRLAARAAIAFILGIAGASVFSATAEIANAPLATSSTTSIRPNLMFILDDSGSMADDYLPDEANFGNLCFGDYRLNQIFYNPNRTYNPPVDESGVRYADASFTAAKVDGFNAGSATVDLSVVANLSTPSTKVGTTTGQVCDWERQGGRWVWVCRDGTVDLNSRFYYSSYTTSSAPACSGNSYNWQNFSFVTDASGWTAAQKTNYANWYSYYRTRMLMMRTAAGQVFAEIDPSRFRVGFSTIHDSGASDGNEFLNIRDFDATGQKTTFFSKLYATAPGGSTPLRSALAKAGRYYGKRLSNQSDPIQYSCQRNYTILSTDGYWNTGDEWNNSVTQLNGSTAIGNQDSKNTTPATELPYLDDWRRNNSTGGDGLENTLADIAMYYYKTDLRDGAAGSTYCTGAVSGQNVCTNNVERGKQAGDVATWQHMKTITLGLGVSGTMTYDPNYEKQTSGSYYNIVNGSAPWPNPIANSGGERIDDLWHAAVNGRGHYYSASDPTSLSTSLRDALESIDAASGAGAAAATSNLRPESGDNFAYVARYKTALWNGDLEARTVDVTTGDVSSTRTWSAATLLLSKVSASSDTRTIKFFDPTNGGAARLSDFTYSRLQTASLNASFDDLCPSSGTPKLSQCSDTTLDKSLMTGANLVNWLRGQSQHEDLTGNAARLFRDRYDGEVSARNVLGDIVNSVPVYVKKPSFKYVDSGYSTFASSNAGRQAVVYTAANDGMLHAFNADTGVELWAYVPRMVMHKLYKLADKDYASQHQYYVDGAPTVADVYDPSGTGGWKTILIGGLNAGGRGYYALDVTDPSAPIGLWEYSSANDSDLGLSFGNPVVTKLKDGSWVVAFTSGYNNVSPGTGNGHLFVLNAMTGVQIAKIPTYISGTTAAGDTTTPNNLGRINAWVADETDNTIGRIYGGDMRGNVWRFDLDDNIAPSGSEALLLGQARSAGGAVQPITVKPELTEITSNGQRYALVSVGTGRYLGSGDIGDGTTQSVYVFKDTLGSTGLGNLRAAPGMVAQTLGANRAVTTPQSITWSTDTGWYADFSQSSGERVDVDMQQQLDMLIVATNVPSSDACVTGGSSWLYYFNIKTGATLVPALSLGNALTAGITTIQLPSGLTKTIAVSKNGNIRTEDDPDRRGSGSGVRRTSWRELAN